MGVEWTSWFTGQWEGFGVRSRPVYGQWYSQQMDGNDGAEVGMPKLNLNKKSCEMTPKPLGIDLVSKLRFTKSPQVL